MDIPFNRPWRAGREMEFLSESLASGMLCGDGPYTKRAQAALERITGAAGALLTTSCTMALELAALGLDLQPGDQVIVPSFTFVSTANPFQLRGANIVFADIDPRTMNMDPKHVESIVTDRTRVVVPVHYAGVGCDLDPILALSRPRGIRVVEDAAQCIGACRNGKPLGTVGTFGTISFHETKNIGCGEGGVLLINDPAYLERAAILREKGTNRSQFLAGTVDKYTWVDAGSSFLPADLLAAILVAQLEELDSITACRRRSWSRYHERLLDLHLDGRIVLPDPNLFRESNGHIFWLLCGRPEERPKLIEFLAARGIQATFHYVPLHLSPMGKRLGGREGQLPVTEALANRLVRLPMWAELREEQIDAVASAVREFYLA
jgi:dTDP-4-amino-4,6-dideoxygalactose transaminase